MAVILKTIKRKHQFSTTAHSQIIAVITDPVFGDVLTIGEDPIWNHPINFKQMKNIYGLSQKKEIFLFQ
jgi:hypothetical protein